MLTPPAPIWRLVRLRLASCLLVAINLFAALPLPGRSQTVPEHKLDLNRATGACRVTLTPRLRSDPDSPVFVIRTEGSLQPDGFAIEFTVPGRLQKRQIVQANQRTEFTQFGITSGRKMADVPTWRSLNAAWKSGEAFHLSAQRVDGGWTSSLYNPIDPMGIVLLLERNCGFESDHLTARSAADLAVEERRLILTPDQIQHIRWVLIRRFGTPNDRHLPVLPGQFLTAQERGFLERYAAQVGEPRTQYLTARLSQRLINETFTPADIQFPRETGRMTHDYWISARDPSRNRCILRTAALSWTGAKLFERPVFQGEATVSAGGNGMAWDFLSPNPFDTSRPAWAVVDGRRFALQFENNRFLKPSYARGGRSLDSSVIEAIRAGTGFQIVGTAAGTGQPLAFEFSARGFTAAFQQFARNCNNTRLLDWIR